MFTPGRGRLRHAFARMAARSASDAELTPVVRPPAEELTLRAGDLAILPRSQQVIGPSTRAQLTKRETDVLLVLIDQLDRVVRREEIYSAVWGGSMPYRDRAVDVYVKRLRAKFRNVSDRYSYVHTHTGIGYRFTPELDSAHG